MSTIATLIPAYKPQYLLDLVVSLRSQSRRPDRVIVSDDNPTGQVTDLLRSAEVRSITADLPLELIPGPRRGAFENVRHLLARWDGASDLVHVMLDDDVVYPDFYTRHEAAHAAVPTLCSVSRRWVALESGLPVGEGAVPDAVAANDGRLLGVPREVVFGTTVAACNNWLGEFSNAVFSGAMAERIARAELGGVPVTGLEDIGAFLVASLDEPLVVINDHLGFFRRNPHQGTGNLASRNIMAGHLAWPAIAIASLRLGAIAADEAAACIARIGATILGRYEREPAMTEACARVRELLAGAPDAADRYLDMWRRFATQS
jgi:hypothetical protein